MIPPLRDSVLLSVPDKCLNIRGEAIVGLFSRIEEGMVRLPEIAFFQLDFLDYFGASDTESCATFL